MVDFGNYNEALRWLEAQPREVSVVIAARAALRVLPLLDTARWQLTAHFRSAMVLPCFCAAAVAWAAAKYPALGATLRTAANGAATNAADAAVAARAAVAPVFAVTDATRSAIFAAGNAAVAAGSAADASIDAARAAVAAVFAATDAVASMAVADAVAAVAANTADAAAIEIGDNPDQRRLLAAELAGRALWLGAAPPWAAVLWSRLRVGLLAANDDWEVWAEWYDDRLAGRATADPAIDLAYALPPDALRRHGPKVVNAEIKQLIAPARLPAEEALPKQTTGAAIFVRHSSGVIDIAPPGPKDRLADTDEVREFYCEVRVKTADLGEVGANMLGARLARTVATFQDRTPANVAGAVERRVWSSGNTLRSILTAHDKVADDRDAHPDKLDRGAAERLRDVVDTFNQLAVADPALRQRDASRPGPQEHDRSARELKIAVEITAVAARDRSITTPQAGDELLEHIDPAARAGSDVPGRLAVELARDTSRNFYAEAMIGTYRFLRTLPATARGEGGFISKEYSSGIYKAAGAATFTAVLGAAASAYYITPEIINFILSNAPTLKAYAVLAFEHSPGFRQMIDWLELHVPDQDE